MKSTLGTRFLLGGICVLMAALFYLSFTQPYSWSSLSSVYHGTMSSISRLSGESAFVYVGSFVALFLMYGAAIVLVGRLDYTRKITFFSILGGGGLCCALLLPMYPYDSDDVWDYIIRGRMTAYYDLNPMQAVPDQISQDPFTERAAWKVSPSAYGAGWEWIAALTVHAAGNDVTANLFAFKFVAILGYAVTGLFVWLTLQRLDPRRALIGTTIWLWNPFVILMVGSAAHNDTIMTAFMLLGIYLMVRHWYIAATLAAAAGALVKFIPLALVAICIVVALRDLNGRLRLRYVLLGGILVALLSMAINLRFYTGNPADLLSLDRRAKLYTGSTATVIRQTLIPLLDKVAPTAPGSQTPITNGVISTSAFGLLGIFGAWQLWDVWQDKTHSSMKPVQALLLIILFYMLVSAFWFMSWYILWAVPLAALLPNTFLRRFVISFSYLVSWEMLLYQYITLRPGNWAAFPWRDMVPVASYMGVSYAWIAWHWLRLWWRRSRIDLVMFRN